MNQKQKFRAVYVALNEMLASLTADGGIDCQDAKVEKIFDALYELDKGQYKPEIFDNQEDSHVIDQAVSFLETLHNWGDMITNQGDLGMKHAKKLKALKL